VNDVIGAARTLGSWREYAVLMEIRQLTDNFLLRQSIKKTLFSLLSKKYSNFGATK